MDTQLSLFDLQDHEESPFESIKHLDDNGEYWLARELLAPLGYGEYRFFKSVIDKAKISCENGGHSVADHFEDMHDMVDIGSGAQRKIENVKLSRLAIAQNGDPRKKAIADAQTYFAVQTRRQELSDVARLEGKDDRKEFTATAQKSHCMHAPDYARLTNTMYQILFGAAKGELVKELKLDYRQAKKFRDHISTLALRAIQAAEAGASAQFGGLSGLSTEKQIEIVRQYARIFAPAFNEAAEVAGIDLLSGNRLLNPIDAILGLGLGVAQ